jgi:hypothetical protein
MYSLKFNGFKTQKQAQAFLDWYGGQGEQDAQFWFECRMDDDGLDVNFMPVDNSVIPVWEDTVLNAQIKVYAPEPEEDDDES